MISIIERFNTKIILLFIVSVIVSIFGFIDAVLVTNRYKSITNNTPDQLLIIEKSEFNNLLSPPTFYLKCTHLSSQDTANLKVSKGNFDDHMVSDSIVAFRLMNSDFITEYEIDNSLLIQIGKHHYSFFYIPAFLFAFIALVSLRYLTRKTKND